MFYQVARLSQLLCNGCCDDIHPGRTWPFSIDCEWRLSECLVDLQSLLSWTGKIGQTFYDIRRNCLDVDRLMDDSFCYNTRLEYRLGDFFSNYHRWFLSRVCCAKHFWNFPATHRMSDVFISSRYDSENIKMDLVSSFFARGVHHQYFTNRFFD